MMPSIPAMNNEHSYMGPRQFVPEQGLVLSAEDCANYADLRRIGIDFSERIVQDMHESMDALQPTITTGSIATPVQFLQAWLPGFAYIVTQARKIDELVGIMTAGAWEDEEAVQGVMELTGTAVPYGDYTNVPQASWNVNFERRTIVRFEEGLKVGILEEARAGRMQVNSPGSKRESAALALEIQRNTIGFSGYNSGNGRTYGFLNDPGLPNYVTVANPGSGTQWTVKNFLQICADIRTAVVGLRNSSGDTIDPYTTPITLAVSSNRVDYLSVTSDFGISVMDWIKTTYPKMRVTSAPQLNGANASANVFYLYAEKVNDQSTDGGRVFVQIVPTKFKTLGVEKQAKAYVEDFSNATAGVMCKRPFAVYRASGI